MISDPIKSLSDTSKILFVCKGNICRSPFAQYYAQKVFPSSVKISSSGYHEKTGRKCPWKAIKAAKEYNIQLKNHRSSLVSKDLIQDSQFIFIFDEENRKTLHSQFPYAKNKIYFLGSLNEKLATIINDPYGKEFSQYKITFKLISKYIDIINSYL